MSEAAVWETDLGTLGREIGREKSKRLGSAINAVFALIATIAAGEAGAQGGPCLTNCGDHTLPPIIVTPGGGGGSGPYDPCAGGGCGNDVPPDQGGAPTTPPQLSRCEQFLRYSQPPVGCRATSAPEMPSFGRGCNFTHPAFVQPYVGYQRQFSAACNMQMQCYWSLDDKSYCNDQIRQEAYAGCANFSPTNDDRAACVDKATSFISSLVGNPRGLNMMGFEEIRASVACVKWKGEFDAACR